MKAKKKKWMSLVFAPILTLGLTAPAFASVPGIDPNAEGAKEGIVAVSHPLAAEAGRKVLAEGGNAVDAAAAIQMSLNVVEPMMSGIGGGAFIMIYLKDKNEFHIIDSREMAPKNVTADLFIDKATGKPIPFDKRHTNGKAVGVPGTLLGFETALKKYGTMPLSHVIDPAIEQAKKGIKVNWSMASYVKDTAEKLKKNEAAASVFLPNGKPIQEGDTLVQPDLAKTLKLIKEQGAKVFYNGEIGQAIAAEVQKQSGSMTMDDIKHYTVKEREPVRGTYRGYEVVSMPPPSSGGLTVLEILKMLEGYDLKKMGSNSAEYLHHYLEAMHLAYADRAAYMADEDFYPVPKQGLLDDRYIQERRQLINSDKASTSVQAGNPWKYEENKNKPEKIVSEQNPTGQTTHFSVIDKWGNMVACTTTIEEVFGSGIMVPGYGFMLNNEMTDFDAVPGGVNQVEPYKRPRSSMSPTMLLKDGQPFMALGSPGGSTIIASVSQSIINVIDFGMPIQKAILTPRVYSSEYPNVSWENGIPEDVRLELMEKGHAFNAEPQDIGNVQAALYDAESKKMYGGADNTREGTVLGVDGISYTSTQPTKLPTAAPVPFTVANERGTYPYRAEQMALKNGTSFIEAEALLKGLGGHLSKFTHLTVNWNGKTYLPIRKTAEALGYKVLWNAVNKTVMLQRTDQIRATK
jgi:gamma-glutamyltranspeptidase/glutathione hydrolase